MTVKSAAERRFPGRGASNKPKEDHKGHIPRNGLQDGFADASYPTRAAKGEAIPQSSLFAGRFGPPLRCIRLYMPPKSEDSCRIEPAGELAIGIVAQLSGKDRPLPSEEQELAIGFECADFIGSEEGAADMLLTVG